LKSKVDLADRVQQIVDESCEEHKAVFDKFIGKYKKNENRLDKIIKQSDRLQSQLINLNDELNDYKDNLELKVQEEIQKRKDKEKMLEQQSKLAAMGEMIDAVAHQWKQPLTIIGLNTKMLPMDFDFGDVDREYIEKFSEKVEFQLDHLINPLDEFRSFFRPNAEMAEFEIRNSIKNVLLLLKDTLLSNQVEVEYNDVDYKILGIENEFKHILINIINNAKDAFNEKEIKERTISITTTRGDRTVIEIVDNAGGIPEKVLPNIFKPNVTTKEVGKGTGIGLYMSKQIVEKMQGTIDAVNVDGGVKFILSFENRED